jgi:hypothetical protein
MLRLQAVFLNTMTIGLLLTGMAAIHPEIRRHIENIVSGDAVGELATVSSRVSQAGHYAVATFHGFQADNSSLVLFALVAVVLFVLMLRS